jgi:dolichyl-phosphate-mannose-protein mannosyltransferase
MVHYFPFFLMSRQLFIHHYLPSHLASALVAGAVLHFLLSETIDYPISIAGHFTVRRPPQWAELGTRGPVIVVGFFFALAFGFIYIAPLTYGTPGYVLSISAISTWVTYALRFRRLDGETVNAKRLLSSWTLHFAAKPFETA